MKIPLIPMVALLGACGLHADHHDEKPSYVDEAPLPEGWPKPGPYNEVTKKSYPAYRAAFNMNGGGSGAFWTLFAHINRNDIPMTAPVEVAVESATNGTMSRNSMGFLYQNTKVGEVGKDGSRVEIRDVAPARALSYAWQGPDSEDNLNTAKSALEAELAKRSVKATGFRLLGYNGPRTPRAKKTWELQALLE